MKTQTGSAQRFDSLGRCPFWFFHACEASRRPVWAIQELDSIRTPNEFVSAVLGRGDRDASTRQILRCKRQRKPCYGGCHSRSSTDYGQAVRPLLPPVRQAVALCGQFGGKVASVPPTSSFSPCWGGVTRMWAAVPFWPWFALREKKPHQMGQFCHSGAVEPRCGESRFWGDLARSKKVQDKERGSPAPPAQVTPSRNAGRGNGLRDLKRGPHRWSVWIKADVIGGLISEKRASNPCGWAVPQVDVRGAPWGSWGKSLGNQ